MPEELDDAIKGYHADCFMATNKLTVEELSNDIPLGFLRTHVIDEKLCLGIAKNPIDNSENSGHPYLSTKSWVKLVLNNCWICRE